MRIKTFLALVLLCSNSLTAQTRGVRKLAQKSESNSEFVAANSAQLPIRRVVLYSNGVAYIERRGMIAGNAEINLSFKQSQVDDVLKSMLVLDSGAGRINAVSYNSSLPAAARTAEIPFAVEAKTEDGGGIAEVLAQLQGARVAVSSAARAAVGSILTVEKRPSFTDKDRPAMPAYYLVIASDAGEISNFALADVRSVKLLDDGTRRDLSEFAGATASTRRRDAKTITVSSVGAGARELIVSYTIAAPIWKTTYRVVLDEAGKPFFQGWAIVDNVSEEDWQGVQLSLVSGSPVSFIQNLQKPLYRYRPIVPIPEDLNLQPQIYDPENGEGSGNGTGDGNGVGYGSGNGVGSPPPPPAPKPLFDGANNNFIVSSGFSGTSVSDAIVGEKSGVETVTTGAEIGDLFEYRIEQPVSVARNRSALIPIIQAKMDGERVSIFRDEDAAAMNSDDADEPDEQEAVRRANPRPMSGLLLKNTSAMTFEGGSMTVLDRDAYAGEALMERLKPKEQRLISFALDLGTLFRVERKEERQPAKLIKVVDGTFQVHYFKTAKKIYRLSNQTDRPKVVYVEHPVREKWILASDSAKPDYTTARFYRFRVPLAAFENKEITVAENLGMMDKYSLATFSPKDLDVFVSSRFIDEATRAKLAKLIELRMQINQANARLQQLETEIAEITKDQERFRENIEALAKTPEAKTLIARYIAKANEQESRLEQINTEKRTHLAEKEKAERALAIEIKNLEIN